MSPIGRVFLVLNLGLAGAFVAFSGTYLQRADHWRDKFQAKEKEMADEVSRLKSVASGLQAQLQDKTRIADKFEIQKNQLQTKVDEATRDNAALQNRLTTLEGSMKASTAHLSNIATELAAARQDAKAASDRAIAAEAAKDDAEAKMNAAEKALADANFKNKNQADTISNMTATIASREQTIREKEVLLDLVNRRYPAIFETLHPLVTGTVSKVGASGNLVTIALKSGAENLKPGARFAIFNAKDGYLGEATVSEVDGSKSFCFARLTLQQGKKISAGDSASTNLTGAGSN